MDRSVAVLLALFWGVEPVVAGLIAGEQRLIFLWLLNLVIVLLRYATTASSTKTHLITGAPLKATHAASLNASVNWVHATASHTLKSRATYYGAIAAIALIGGLLSAFFNETTVVMRTASALISAGVIYWILSLLVHGVGATRRKNVSKLFGLLIIVGLWRGYVGGQNAWLWGNSLQNIFSGLFDVPTVMAPVNTALPSGHTEISSGTISGETSLTPSDIAPATGTIPSATPTWTAIAPTTGSTAPSLTTSMVGSGSAWMSWTENNTEPLTFARVVPAIVTAYKLPVPSGSINFANIPSTSPVYNAFKAGYGAKFFGASINPDNLVSCNVYFVMLGLAQKRDVDYTSDTIFTVYAKEAAARGQARGCVSGKYVTTANLP